MKREISVRSEITKKDTYFVIISPGVDLAFISVLVNIIEENIVEQQEVSSR